MPVKIKSENSTRILFVKWLKQEYGRLLVWHIDFFSDLEMDERTRARYFQLQRGKGWPDFFLAHPSGNYHGLFLEIKTDFSEVYNQDYSLKADPHIREQAGRLAHFRAIGYKAEFGLGLEDCKNKVLEYLS